VRSSLIQFIILFMSLSSTVLAFDNDITHTFLTETAIQNSGIGDIISRDLKLPEGIKAYVHGKFISDWLKEGAFQEDEPDCRASNHFHNPLRTWTASHMTDRPWLIDFCCSGGEYPPENITANVTWATGYTAPGPDGEKVGTGNLYDWDHARQYYYTYLSGKDLEGSPVAVTDAAREGYFAKSLTALGQVLHLLQDMAVPAHVRNDFRSHLDFSGILQESFTGPSDKRWYNERFEHFVKQHIDELLADISGGDLDDPILTKFWDADAYDPNAPDPTVSLNPGSIGLAEFTNINFASKNTVFTEDYPQDHEHYHPYPRRASTNLDALLDRNLMPKTVEAEDGVVDTGLWLSKTTDGLTIEHFLKPTYFTLLLESLPEYEERLLFKTFIIDDACARNYAELLVPRAIGYSAGLLDYFFRGRIDVQKDENGSGYIISNESDEEMDGVFELYYDKGNEERRLIWSALRSLGPAGSGSDETGLAFSIPTDAGTPGRYILVFRGRLGNEPGAVIGKSVFLGEAFCVVMQGVWDQRWTFVWDMLRNRPADIRDGRGQPLAYPVREDNTTLRMWLAHRTQVASERLLDFQIVSGEFMGVECSDPYSHGFFPFDGRPDTYWDCDTGGSSYGHWEMETAGSQGQTCSWANCYPSGHICITASTDIYTCTPAKSYHISQQKYGDAYFLQYQNADILIKMVYPRLAVPLNLKGQPYEPHAKLGWEADWVRGRRGWGNWDTSNCGEHPLPLDLIHPHYFDTPYSIGRDYMDDRFVYSIVTPPGMVDGTYENSRREYADGHMEYACESTAWTHRASYTTDPFVSFAQLYLIASKHVEFSTDADDLYTEGTATYGTTRFSVAGSVALEPPDGVVTDPADFTRNEAFEAEFRKVADLVHGGDTTKSLYLFAVFIDFYR